MENPGIHVAIIISMAIIAVSWVNFMRKNRANRDSVYKRTDRMADQADSIGGYENLIAIERQRQAAKKEKQKNA